MGEKYKATLEKKIAEVGGANLRVFMNAAGLDPHYQQHLEGTFKEAGVTFVNERGEANFVFEGDCEPSRLPGQIVAFFKGGDVAFEGSLNLATI